MRKFAAVLAVLILAGCTTAGPFVTNVNPAYDGSLVVEKCQVHFNGFLGVIDMGQCMSTSTAPARR